jgi:hypothetical protein
MKFIPHFSFRRFIQPYGMAIQTQATAQTNKPVAIVPRTRSLRITTEEEALNALRKL